MASFGVETKLQLATCNLRARSLTPFWSPESEFICALAGRHPHRRAPHTIGARPSRACRLGVASLGRSRRHEPACCTRGCAFASSPSRRFGLAHGCMGVDMRRAAGGSTRGDMCNRLVVPSPNFWCGPAVAMSLPARAHATQRCGSVCRSRELLRCVRSCALARHGNPSSRTSSSSSPRAVASVGAMPCCDLYRWLCARACA